MRIPISRTRGERTSLLSSRYLYLKEMFNLTDQEALEQLEFNLLWHHALGLDMELRRLRAVAGLTARFAFACGVWTPRPFRSVRSQFLLSVRLVGWFYWPTTASASRFCLIHHKQV